MRTIELSNHPGDQLRKIQRERRTAEQQARSDYQEAFAQHGYDLAVLRQRRDAARARHRWWAWLRRALAVGRARRAVPSPQRVSRQPSSREASIQAGIEGEQQVAGQLGRVLSDEWTLLRGYRNRFGEIDHLLLGPRGLVAIEGKHHSATIHCDGDDWWFDKYDRYGNHVGRGLLADRGGRSPSQQLNEPAAALEEFLARRGQPVPVQRVVLLTHPRSRLGTHRNPTVSIATSTSEVLSLLSNPSATLDPPQRNRIENLIIRDHQFHQARRNRPPRKSVPLSLAGRVRGPAGPPAHMREETGRWQACRDHAEPGRRSLPGSTQPERLWRPAWFMARLSSYPMREGQ